MTEEQFQQNLKQLHHDIVQQGGRVEALVARAFDAVFDGDQDKARQVIAEDDVIDRVDVDIERRAVALLTMGSSEPISVRMVLTIVKVNNELERMADHAADVAEQVVLVMHLHDTLPPTLRVMVNSVVGMIRDAIRAMGDRNPVLARSVLSSDDLVEEFKTTIMREAQEHYASGDYSIDYVLSMWRIVTALNRIAEHTTNICEQVIYVETGQIVRHSSEGWSEPVDA